MNRKPKFVLTLYVSTCNEATEKKVRELREALTECLKDEIWVLNLVEVATEPEKAVANDIFATPTLVRETPEPVIKILNGLARIPQVLSAITEDRKSVV
jgi:circadian clock protein KaiB